MMKSPTSLIRFRNAVGVVLALSAVFAVVISAVTFTQDRAFAQNGNGDPTVSLVLADDTVAEKRRNNSEYHGHVERSRSCGRNDPSDSNGWYRHAGN